MIVSGSSEGLGGTRWVIMGESEGISWPFMARFGAARLNVCVIYYCLLASALKCFIFIIGDAVSVCEVSEQGARWFTGRAKTYIMDQLLHPFSQRILTLNRWKRKVNLRISSATRISDQESQVVWLLELDFAVDVGHFAPNRY